MMTIHSDYALLKRAVVLFPRNEIASDTSVRHARRKWIDSIKILRNRAKSKWILDEKVFRKCAH